MFDDEVEELMAFISHFPRLKPRAINLWQSGADWRVVYEEIEDGPQA